MIFIRASISIKGHNITMLIKIQKSEKDETQSLFFKLKQPILWLVFLLIIAITTTFTHFYYSILYLANILLDYSIVPYGFDIRP